MLGFIAVAVVVIVAPGPDFALTVRNVLRGGGRATAFGVVAGQLVWVLATSAGVAALLVASHPAFVALKIVGALYLVWLGLSMLVRRDRATRVSLVARAGSLLGRARVRRVLDTVTGIVLVAFGVHLATERR